MGEQLPDTAHLMALGKAATDAYRASPPDPGEWARTFDGLAELCRHAAQQCLDARHENRDFARLVNTISSTADRLRMEAVLAYVLSGGATDDFLAKVREHHGGTNE